MSGDLTQALNAPPTKDAARFDRARGVLTGAECSDCNTRSWPARLVCNVCGSAQLAAVDLAVDGELRAATRVWVPRPGIEAPYWLGLVDLEAGPRILGHVRGVEVPHPTCEVVVRIAPNDADVPWFWFDVVERLAP